MAGVSITFKFSLFTVTILFGILAVSSSSEFYEEEFEERDDRSAESEADVRQYWQQHYQWQRPVQQVHHNHQGQYHYPQPVVVPQLPKCGNHPQCKSCKAPTVPNYQPKSPSARSTRQTNFVEEESQIEEFHSEEEYDTRFYQPVKQYHYQNTQHYYQTTQPPRRQCNAVCKPPVPVTTQKPYVPQTPAYPHYQQPQYQQYQQPQYQYRPYGR